MKIHWIQGEYWYGGAACDGIRQPVGQGDIREINLEPNSTPNQAMPFFLSSKGRYLWGRGGFSVRFDREGITCPDDAKLGKGFGTLRGAYLAGMKRHFPFHPFRLSERLFDAPVYNTWIELTFYQSQQAVLDYARGIVGHGMEPGVLMIDDGWSECYGDWRFHSGRFPDPAGMVKELKAMGFSVMIWVCPFVTPDSIAWRDAGERGILAAGPDGEPYLSRWWNGYSGVLDFSRKEAVSWFDRQMMRLQETGVDGFKFDAGDSIYYPREGCGRNEQSRLWAQYGERYSFNEYRASWKAGGYSLMQRLCDKEHSWGEKGIGALIPDTLVQGLTGHPYCCPDLVGGGEYLNFAKEKEAGLDQELFLCHSETACMMPVIQFSAAPWRILDEERFKRLKEQLDIRKAYGKERAQALSQAAATGEPVIRPMEYSFPGQGMETVMDQFMMGERLLVAPCIKKGETGRLAALPKGRWKYGGHCIEGGGSVYLSRETAGPIILEYMEPGCRR
ncbi:glycoside hydrolase family 31 protein [Diplocloster modestus]|uniref:Glycoside hydrolase family 31 protein n=1 Tax=Diplocloster modestus TaxID=2850322 RepID=A0ABS6KAC1_9FIRM|nr:glycoside hydrolase family 31 protein [Diplocloster modestus]MBU9727464.1 glycoside hydrolase family 31 protein [Diplocloster modestus]